MLRFAHFTNQLGQSGDLEKGEANGATASLALIHAVVVAYLDTWTRQDQGAGQL